MQGHIGELIWSKTKRHLKSFFQFVEDRDFEFELLVNLRHLPYSRSSVCHYLFSTARFAKGQKIIKRKTKPRGIYFILKGNVQICDENNKPVLSLPTFSYFGDQIFLEKNSFMHYMYLLIVDIALEYFTESQQILCSACLFREAPS